MNNFSASMVVFATCAIALKLEEENTHIFSLPGGLGDMTCTETKDPGAYRSTEMTCKVGESWKVEGSHY